MNKNIDNLVVLTKKEHTQIHEGKPQIALKNGKWYVDGKEILPDSVRPYTP